MTATLAALRRGELAGSRELDLSHAGLLQCPDDLYGLADTLEVLDLSGNALTTLPAGFGRLRNLRVLFCSGNCFDVLPPVLGDCPALSQLGCRGSGVQELPAESLPPAIRWLTLTDNRLSTLPAALGQRPKLQKLMLSGNHLVDLPDSLAGAQALELLRLSANRLDALPSWLADMPRLAWLAWAGNPFDRGGGTLSCPAVEWAQLEHGAVLGEGASGRVHQAIWRVAGGPARPVAVKLFKGVMTSDGLPEREMATCLAAGAHPNLMGAIGRIAGHPGQLQGLVMPLLPPHWRVLAGPPSRDTCSRDVYAPDCRFDLSVALRIARCVGLAAAHAHARGLMHGDLYAHNVLWDGVTGEAVLSDFGAASFLPPTPSLAPIEVLAWGVLLGELLDRCGDALPSHSPLWDMQRHCVQENPRLRPSVAEAIASIAAAA